MAPLPGGRPVVDFGALLSIVVLSSQVLLSALSSQPSGQAQEVEGPERRSLRKGELMYDDLWFCFTLEPGDRGGSMVRRGRGPGSRAAAVGGRPAPPWAADSGEEG